MSGRQFEAGDRVVIARGRFYGYEGVIQRVAADGLRATVGVMIFGRQAPLDLPTEELDWLDDLPDDDLASKIS